MKAKTIADVQNAVAKHFNIQVEELCSLANAKKLSTPRKIAIFLVNRLETEFSNAQIAAAFGYNDKRYSTTVTSAFNQVQAAFAKPVGQKSNHEVDMLADVHEIAKKAGIDLE